MFVVLDVMFGYYGFADCPYRYFPSSYTYESRSLLNPTVDDQFNCRNTTISGTPYTTCNHPALLTDSVLGPDIYAANSSNNVSHYLFFSDEASRILITFPENVLLTTMTFYYYIDSVFEVSLPKIRTTLVPDNFQVTSEIGSLRSLTVDTIEPTPELRGLNNKIVSLTGEFHGETTKFLIRIQDHKDYDFAFTEIIFCSNGMCS